MAKFKFYQDTKINAWVRDYYEIEAETLEDAIDLVKGANVSLDDLENKDNGVVWQERDTSLIYDTMTEEECFGVYSVDLENGAKYKGEYMDSEIL